MEEIFVREETFLRQYRYLVSAPQVVVALVDSPDVLAGKQFSRVKLKADRLEGVGVQAHLDIDQLAVFGPAIDVETDLSVAQVVNGRLVGDDGDNGHVVLADVDEVIIVSKIKGITHTLYMAQMIKKHDWKQIFFCKFSPEGTGDRVIPDPQKSKNFFQHASKTHICGIYRVCEHIPKRTSRPAG
jgi:hypothetical protein